MLLHSIRLSLIDVMRIFEKLQWQVHEEAALRTEKLLKPENQSQEEFEAEKLHAREQAFRVTVTISGSRGSSLFGDDIDLFRSPNLPEQISSIYMTNLTAFESVAGSRPVNYFELLLDFSKPPLIDAQTPVSSPTPNNSSLTVQGDRDSWVSSVSESVLSTTDLRRTRRSWIHKAFVYDLGAAFLGFPAGIYVCWKFSSSISKVLEPVHSFLSGAMYVYLFLIALWFYRLLFGYTKWAFPTVELTDNHESSAKHRAFWTAIVMALSAQIIWEILF